MKYTVLGSSGFIGSHVAALATQQGHEVDRPARDEKLDGRDLGHVVFAIGITSDFRSRPYETVTAHVTKLQEILTTTSFDSLVYLSSTRVYSRCPIDPLREHGSAVSEEMPVGVLSSDFSDLYNLSKLMGESLALTHGSKAKIARLSNVVGPDFASDNFLISVVRDCVKSGKVKLRTSLDSSKDYVAVQDVARIVLKLGTEGQHSIYNVASGSNTTSRTIVQRLAELTGSTVEEERGSPTVSFPRIDVGRIEREFGFVPQNFEAMISSLVSEFRSHLSLQNSKNAA